MYPRQRRALALAEDDAPRDLHVIVHQAGEVPRGPEGKFLRDLASREIGLTIDNAQQLFLSREFCTLLVEATETFFGNAYAAAGLSYEPWNDKTMKT